MAIVNSNATSKTQKPKTQDREDQNQGEVINPLALKDSGELQDLDLSVDPNEILPPPAPGKKTLQIVPAEKDPYRKFESTDRNTGEVVGIYYKFFGTVIIHSPDAKENGARFDITLSTRIPARKGNSEVAFFLSSLGYELPSQMSQEKQIQMLAKWVQKGESFTAEVDWKAFAYCPDDESVKGYYKFKTYEEFPDSETHEGKENEGSFVDRQGNNMVWRAKPYVILGTAKKVGGAKAAAPAPAAAPAKAKAAAPAAKKAAPPSPAPIVVETESSDEIVEEGVSADEDEFDLN